jgi:predicted regulator of Ras-like GTPase activity (Roadblock/LC7/MglB family)
MRRDEVTRGERPLQPSQLTTPPQKETPVNADVSRAPLDTARADVLAELHAMRGDIAQIEGSIVATTDGLVIAHDLGHSETFGIEPEGVAALSAVNLGLSQRIADTASHGHLQETVVRGSFGQVVTYPAGGRALLTVLVRAGGDVDGLHTQARQVAERVAELLTDSWQDDAFTWRSP